MSISNIKAKYADVLRKFSVYERDNEISVSLVVVDPSARGQGIGRQVFQDLNDYADQVGKTIVLTPDSSFGTKKSDLVRFYKSLGFVMNKGRDKDYEISELMYRKPILKQVKERSVGITKEELKTLVAKLVKEQIEDLGRGMNSSDAANNIMNELSNMVNDKKVSAVASEIRDSGMYSKRFNQSEINSVAMKYFETMVEDLMWQLDYFDSIPEEVKTITISTMSKKLAERALHEAMRA